MARKTTENQNSTKSKSSSSGSAKSGGSKKLSSSTKPLNTSPKKTQAQIANTRTSQEVFMDQRNSLFGHLAAILFFGFLTVFLILTFFNADGTFLHFLRYSVTGVLGLGYILLPFAFLFITWFLIAHNDQPALRRSFFIIMADFFFSATIHTLLEPDDISGSLSEYLWSSGQSLKSGGLLPGMFAHCLRFLVSRPGAFFVCAVLMLVCLIYGLGLRLDLFINTKANQKRESIQRAQEQQIPVPDPEEIDTSADLRVLLTPSRTVKQEREHNDPAPDYYTPYTQTADSGTYAPTERTIAERASFDVPLGEEASSKPARKKGKKKRSSDYDSENGFELFTQPSFSRPEQARRNAYDVSLGSDNEAAGNGRFSGARKKSAQSVDPNQTSIDDMLVFAKPQKKHRNDLTENEPRRDPDLPFVASTRRKSKMQVSQTTNQWDMSLGDPVDDYTSQVQDLVRMQSGISGSNEQSQQAASKRKFSAKRSASTSAAVSESEPLQKSDLDILHGVSTASVVSASLEPAVPIIASPTESEIEAGAKQAKKSGSMNKGEAEAAEAMVSMEIAEGESSDTGTQYHFPPMQILTEAKSSAADNTAEMREKVLRLEATLKSFGIDIKVENVVRGPSVTRYEMELKPGTKMSRITSLNEDIALSLGVASVRVAAVPGKSSTIGIEVPNTISTSVPIRSVMDSKEFRNAKSNLAFAVGKDISGEIIIGDIAKMPHLLIAGTTGSGKSVCMNSIIVSLLYRTKPDQCRMIMIDPKVVELSVYNGIPHLLIPVVTDAKKAAGALQWAVTEMERRYNLLAEYNVRDLAGYNKQAKQRSDIQPLPQIVVIIDELADLMLVAAKEVENSIVRIAQKARAAGMHLVIATQRPSANVITGLMKANIPSRIAFAVSSAIDSRIILDTGGAEKLLGKGDMLFAPIGSGNPKRVQGCFITDDEVESVVSAVRESGTTDYDDSISAQIENTSAASAEAENESAGSPTDYDGDPQFAEAVEVVLDTKQASVSMLQRRLRLGYAHAARIVDEMEEKGIVGPFEGSKPRQLRITREQWNTMVGINPNAKPQSPVDDNAGQDSDPDYSEF